MKCLPKPLTWLRQACLLRLNIHLAYPPACSPPHLWKNKPVVSPSTKPLYAHTHSLTGLSVQFNSVLFTYCQTSTAADLNAHDYTEKQTNNQNNTLWARKWGFRVTWSSPVYAIKSNLKIGILRLSPPIINLAFAAHNGKHWWRIADMSQQIGCHIFSLCRVLLLWGAFCPVSPPAAHSGWLPLPKSARGLFV